MSKVIDYEHMFFSASLANPDVSLWQLNTTPGVELKLRKMFAGSIAEPNVINWNTINVVDASSLFRGISVNARPNVTGWNVKNLTNAYAMFAFADISNSDFSSWNLEKLISTKSMFWGSKGACPNINSWNFSNIQGMYGMFMDNQNMECLDFSTWNFSSIMTLAQFASNSNMSTAQYDALLIRLGETAPIVAYPFPIPLGWLSVGTTKFTPGGAAEAARNLFIANNMTVTDGGPAP